MPEGNLTRAEAQHRSSHVRVESYQVQLDISGAPMELGNSTFRSVTRVEFTSDVDRTWLDLVASDLVSVTLNGAQLPGAKLVGARVLLEPLAQRNTVEVVAECRYSTSGEGLHRFRDPVDGQTYLYTQFATAEARRVFACFEQPDMKAPLTLSVTAPEQWSVIGNSPVSGRVAAESPGQAVTWHFQPTPPLATYVMAVIAGPYHHVEQSHSGAAGVIPLGLWVRASMAQHLDAAELFEVTAAGLDHYERVFDMAYPFAKYDQVFVPEFNLGAMENPGAVTFREDTFIFRSRAPRSAHELRANVILHEMAHMWFGDLVTMRWWDDLWLNESFAEWSGHHVAAQATPYQDSWVTFALAGKAWAARADQLPSTHPVAADMPDLDSVYLNFDGITYAKGAAVLRQLVAWVGLEAFQSGVASYFAAHAWGNTTLVDLLSALSAASGRDLAAWAQKWLQSVGVNTIAVQISTVPCGSGQAPERGEASCYARVSLQQLPALAPRGVPPELRPHRVAVGEYRWQGEGPARRLVRTQRHELDLVAGRVDLPALSGKPVAPLLLPNDGDLTFAKIRFDPVSQRTAFSHVSAVADPLARALIWGCAWDMVRDGELPAADYLEMVCRHLTTETNCSLLSAVHATLAEACTSYLPPEYLPELQAEVAGAAWSAAVAGPAGSDAQILHARAMVRNARLDGQLQVLSGLLRKDGGSEIPGLEVDQDLRWLAVTRLVAMGVQDAALAHREFDRDPTMSGHQALIRALAARPTVEAKAEAWRSAMATAGVADRRPGDQPLSNALLEATISGFTYRDHHELIAGYGPRYYEVVERAWNHAGPSTAVEIARRLFPSWVVSEHNLATAREFAARRDLEAGLARIIADGADGLERALQARGNALASPRGRRR